MCFLSFLLIIEAVIAPASPAEVASEGITLHHCVKTYISKITSGVTNIMFIRKKNQINILFFTVKILNSGNIEQFHEFGNRNACTESGMTEFVKKWAKARKLKTTNFNKVR